MTNKEIVVGGFFETVDAAISNIIGNLAGLLFALLGVGIVGVGIRNAAEWLLARNQVWLALIFVVVCGIAFYGLLTLVTPENSRGTTGKMLRGFIFGFSAAIALVWIYLFGVLSYVLMRLEAVSYTVRSASDALPDLTDAYLWYFLDLVPLLDINGALAWKQPDVDLTGGASGFLLLLFRIILVFQVFALTRKLIEASRAPRTAPPVYRRFARTAR
ncbi:MAG: hypothetical protein H7Y89_15280 [Steroidobacteraceae bacterium]|nr:hypothetical protein [Steroidobacteraceae bacterium]